MRLINYLALILLLNAANADVMHDNTMTGVGLILGRKGQDLIVMGIVSNTPAAAQQDIHAGDRILAVAQGDEPPVQVQGVKLAQAVDMVRGPKGTTVRLTIVSPGEDESQARVVSYVRGTLTLPGFAEPDAAVRRRPKPVSHHWPAVIAVGVALLVGIVLVFYFRRKPTAS